MYKKSVNYNFRKELTESAVQTIMNWKESPKVPLRLAISMQLPRLTVMEVMSVAVA